MSLCGLADLEKGGMNFPMMTLRSIVRALGAEPDLEVKKNRH